MMGRLFRRWADPIVRQQLVRALDARDSARDAVRRLERRLQAERHATATNQSLADRWQSIALYAQEELAAARARLAEQQGDQQ